MREKAKGKGETEQNVVAIRGGSVGTPDSEEGKQAYSSSLMQAAG